MEKQERKFKRLEELDEDHLAHLLQRWQLDEFVEFAREKHIDGMRLLDISEGIVKLWRPKINAKKLITFIEDIKANPYKYLKESNNSDKTIRQEKYDDVEVMTSIENEKGDIENQYQTIPIRKKQENISSMSTVEELLRRIVPPRSFLYRHHQKVERAPSYLPMDAGKPKKRSSFRFSSNEYPFFDMKARFSRQESSNDRGYYAMKRNSRYVGRTCKRTDSKSKYKSLPTLDELNNKCTEDHFYEDLCYNDVEKVKETAVESRVVSVNPCIVKIQELFQAFKVPFFKRQEMTEENTMEKVEVEKVANIYENTDSAANMYDSVDVKEPASEEKQANEPTIPVEEYLEPVQISKDYCDIHFKQKEESILGYILSIFENRFGIRRETNNDHQSSESDGDHKNEISMVEEGLKRPEGRKHGRTSMADRPLPVPVENEPYYMDIDRVEALNLLKGQPDGYFVLRPSSQTDHVYTLSISCANAVHNVGVRRRPDGRLALGFPRRGEHSFSTVASLLRHHRKRRLLLVAGGDIIGATTLNDTPNYYQSPCRIPKPVDNE